MNDCPFCGIVARSVEASVVYEDDEAIAFMDIQPVNPGHVLVAPKRHVSSVRDVDEQLGGRLFKLAMRMEAAIRSSGVRCEGTNMLVADGEAAFQDVFHFHLHVFPRFQGDPFKVDADWKEAPRGELDRVAADIRAAYEARWGGT
jgi:diadenosine tetraphosphate (Ap4A) HIT family hydrolase